MGVLKSHIVTTLKPGQTVLDLGGGDFSKILTDRGLIVRSVDIKSGLSIEDWFAGDPTETYDAILLLNVLQFLDRTWALDSLLPSLVLNLNEGGKVYIETFTVQPTPPFLHKLSFYGIDDLLIGCDLLRPLHAMVGSHTGPGLDGTIREFHIVDFIGEKL